MWKVIFYFSFIVLFHVTWIAADDKQNNREIMQQLSKVMRECNETFHIDRAYINSIKDYGYFPDETDKMPKCFIRCTLMGMNVITDDGEFKPGDAAILYSAIKEGTDIKEAEEVSISCTVRHEKCKCERAYEFMKCITTTMLEKTKKS